MWCPKMCKCAQKPQPRVLPEHGSHFLVASNLAFHTWAELTTMQFAVVRQKLCFYCHVVDASLRCHARCKAALLQICHSAAFQYFRFLVAAGQKNINGLGRVNGTEPSAPLNPGRSIAEAKSENVWMEVCIKVAAAAWSRCLGEFLWARGWARIPVPTPKQERSN